MFNSKIPFYGICILLSLICGILEIYSNMNKKEYSKEEKMAFILYIIIGTIFGAKMYTFYTNYNMFEGKFNFFKLGLSSYGAVIGIIILLIIYSFQFKKKLNELLNIIVTSIPLMYAIGKIGCFLAGCCHGIYYNGILNVVYNYSLSAPKGVKLFPIQIVETIFFISIYIFIKELVKRRIYNDYIVEITFISCGIIKFLLDFFRFSHIEKILSINQIVSIIFVFIGIISIIFKNKRILFKM